MIPLQHRHRPLPLEAVSKSTTPGEKMEELMIATTGGEDRDCKHSKNEIAGHSSPSTCTDPLPSEENLLSTIDGEDQDDDEDPWTAEFKDRALDIIEASFHSMPAGRRSPSLRHFNSTIYEDEIDSVPLTIGAPTMPKDLSKQSASQMPRSSSLHKSPKLKHLIKIFDASSVPTSPSLDGSSVGDLSVSSFFSKSPCQSPSTPKSTVQSPGNKFSMYQSPGKPKSPFRSPGNRNSLYLSPGPPKSPYQSPGRTVSPYHSPCLSPPDSPNEWGSPVVNSPRGIHSSRPRQTTKLNISPPLEVDISSPLERESSKKSSTSTGDVKDLADKFVSLDVLPKSKSYSRSNSNPEDDARQQRRSLSQRRLVSDTDGVLTGRQRLSLSQRRLVSDSDSLASGDVDKRRNKKRIAVRIRPAAKNWQKTLGQSDRFLGVTSSKSRQKDLLRSGKDRERKGLAEIGGKGQGLGLSASMHCDLGGTAEVTTARHPQAGTAEVTTARHKKKSETPELSSSRHRKVISVSSKQMRGKNWQQALGQSDRFLGLTSSASRKQDLLARSPDVRSSHKRYSAKFVSTDDRSVGSNRSRHDRRSKSPSSDRYLGLPFPQRRRMDSIDDNGSVRSAGRSSSNGRGSRSGSNGRADRYLGLSFVSRGSAATADDRSVGSGRDRRSRSRSRSGRRERTTGVPTSFEIRRMEKSEGRFSGDTSSKSNSGRATRTVGNQDIVDLRTKPIDSTPSIPGRRKEVNPPPPPCDSGDPPPPPPPPLPPSASVGPPPPPPPPTESPRVLKSSKSPSAQRKAAEQSPSPRIQRKSSNEGQKSMPRRRASIDFVPQVPTRTYSPQINPKS